MSVWLSIFQAEPDFEQWRERVHCYGLDLRHVEGVESFCAHIRSKFSRLDALINNACQTIRRPAAYYQHMIAGEKEAASDAEAAVLRPLLANHVAWTTSHGAGALLAQVDAPKKQHSAAVADAAAGGSAELQQQQRVRVDSEGNVSHDSAGLSQMAVHPDDDSVTVGPRDQQQQEQQEQQQQQEQALTVIAPAYGGEVSVSLFLSANHSMIA
jgi:NAD(P)-dependent dehydrogenase (short-subunit alcohol dehydrogenase family)